MQTIVKAAGRHGVPVWGQGQGRNKGYGGAAPRISGGITIDFRRMTRALSIDEELGFAVIEPGASFQDIYDAITAADADLLGQHYDTLTLEGLSVGNSAYTAYTANERAILSRALIDETVSVGDEVVIGWGEAGGGYGEHHTRPTEIVPIRAIVSPAPYSRTAREDYRRD